MAYSKMDVEKDWKYPATEPSDEWKLTVSTNPRHDIHWEEYGNPEGEPVIFIHGGPGGGTDPVLARFFDPERYRIILFDQRGCGKSEPTVKDDPEGGLAGNTTANLIEDIEKLRKDLNIKGKAHIFGGSWGSTLSMAYAQAHPEHVKDLVLRGIFLCDKTDLGFFYQGNAATYAQNPNDTSKPGAYRAYLSDDEYTIPTELHDPQMAEAYQKAWDQFVNVIPESERDDMIKAYHDIFHGSDEAKKQEAAEAWATWEGVTSYLNQDVSDLGKFKDPEFALTFSRIENEYFYRALRGQDPNVNDLTKPESLQKLAEHNIPVHIVQGKYDQVCVPASAHTLKAGLEEAGVELNYLETNAGHSMLERVTNAELTNIMDNLEPMRALPEKKGPMGHATRESGGERQR